MPAGMLRQRRLVFLQECRWEREGRTWGKGCIDNGVEAKELWRGRGKREQYGAGSRLVGQVEGVALGSRDALCVCARVCWGGEP